MYVVKMRVKGREENQTEVEQVGWSKKGESKKTKRGWRRAREEKRPRNVAGVWLRLVRVVCKAWVDGWRVMKRWSRIGTRGGEEDGGLLPLPEDLVEQSENLGDVELDVFEVEVDVVVLLL